MNKEPFETVEDAILFAFGIQTTLLMTICTSKGSVSINIRNGSPDREIQPFDKATNRKHSTLTGMTRRRDFSPPT